MLGLAITLASAVKLVKDVTESCQVDVQLEVYAGDEQADSKKVGRRLYAAPVTYRVVQGKSIKYAVAESGEAVGIQVSTLQFLDPVQVTPRDRITLPDGTHPQITSIHGAVSYPGGAYFAPKVYY